MLSVLAPPASHANGLILTTIALTMAVASWALFLKQRRERMTASRRYRADGRTASRWEVRLGGAIAWILMIGVTIFVALPYAVQVAATTLLTTPDVEPRTRVVGRVGEDGDPPANRCIAADKPAIDALTSAPDRWDAYARVSSALLSKCTLIQVSERAPDAAAAFHLSVLQFCENGSLMQERCETTPAPVSDLRPVSNAQTEALTRLLTRNGRSLVVVYVHGWRHDDRQGDSDLRRLFVLANYSAAFANSPMRNSWVVEGVSEGPPARHVVAVYIGWRGNQLQTDDGGGLSTVLAAATFAGRKRVSEASAASVVAVLKAIEAHLETLNQQASPDGTSRNRMLVVGHSAGGNLLMTGLAPLMRDTLVRRLGSNRAWQEPMRGPLGDLTVLINPASEASKWMDSQRAYYETRHAPAPNSVSQVDCTIPFCNFQPPTVMSITAGSLGLTEGERQSRRRSASKVTAFIGALPTHWQDWLLMQSDWVTELVFPVSQRAFEGHWLSPPEASAIGHYRHRSGLRYADQPKKSSLGLSHSMEINGSPTRSTTFANATRFQEHRCLPDPHWLWFARATDRLQIPPNERGVRALSPAEFRSRRVHLALQSASISPPNWDANDIDNDVKSFGVLQRPYRLPSGEGIRFLNAQFMHSLDRGGSPSPVPSAFPYWNVAALDSVLEEHGTFVSHPLWCALHQFVLDRPAEPPDIAILHIRRPHD